MKKQGIDCLLLLCVSLLFATCFHGKPLGEEKSDMREHEDTTRRDTINEELELAKRVGKMHAGREIQRLQLIEKLGSMTATGKVNGYEYVDLGLSVKWAMCNVGASSPTDYGNTYAWGETIARDIDTISAYKYYDSAADSCLYIGSDISGTRYDAAHVEWGGGWRMPTLEEALELEEMCTRKWIAYDNYIGYLVIGPNGNVLFLPAEGYRMDLTTGKGSMYEFGDYWTATFQDEFPYHACSFYFADCYWDWDHFLRYSSRHIRPVLP